MSGIGQPSQEGRSSSYDYEGRQLYYDDSGAKAMTAGDGYRSATNAEGNTTEMTTDPNAAPTEQTQGDAEQLKIEDVNAGQTQGETASAYYDPAQYQNYYYQDDDGNYYYYGDPQQQNWLSETNNDEATANPSHDLIRSYEYENWAPKNYGWFVNIVVDTFISLPFRVYLTIVLFCGAVLVSVMGLNYTFAVLLRMFSPPDPKSSKDMQAFCYLAIFFYLSFIICSAICVCMDMLKNLWWMKREDEVFWGFSQQFFSKRKPPYVIYLNIILVSVFLPLLWGVIDAGVSKQSLVFFAQRYANVAVLVGAFLIVICYVWFYWRALVYKRSAINHYAARDDFTLRARAYKHKPQKMTKTHWYHATTILEEFGVDGMTLRYDTIVFTIGCVPLFALYAAQTLSTYVGTPTVVWGAVSSIALMCVYAVGWISVFHTKGQWSIYATSFLILLLVVLGAVGGGLGSKPQMVGVELVLFFACQGMLTRKRKHFLTKRELSATLKIPYQPDEKKTDKPFKWRVDTYLCCCRDTLLNYMRCIDVRAHFGYRHPEIRRAEREYAIKRIALRTDQKVLVIWWLIVMLAIAFVIALGNGVQYKFSAPIAASSQTSVHGATPDAFTCQLTYNANGSAPMKVYDLALLSALSYTYGANGDVDFATWFSQKPSLIRKYPVHLPPTLNYATDGVEIPFSDFVDTSTSFHFITLNANSRGLSVFRDMDDWGESIALQVAGAISPLINIWPEHYRYVFVRDAYFLKEWFPPLNALQSVKAYIETLLQQGLSGKIVLIGDQFNGGYAKLLSASYQVPFVAFSPPGVKYKLGEVVNGTQFTSPRSLWSYVDSLEDSSASVFLPCDDAFSSNKCGRISTTLQTLMALCGDSNGRTMLEN